MCYNYNMKRRKQLYEVEIKSMAIIREGKKGFITYFEGGPHQQIISNLRILYPQYMDPADKPVVNITKISRKDYNRRIKGDHIKQYAQMIKTEGHIL